MPSYAFATRPRWILSHLFVAALAVAMVLLGLWQLDRLDQRRDRNADITDRLGLPVVDVTELVSPSDPYEQGEVVRFRLATATGEYRSEDEVLIRNRTLQETPGYWVMTPLVLDDGTAVVVNRGWVPFALGPGEDRSESAAPDGRVQVTGLVRETRTARGLESADPSGTALDALARPDLARLQEQLDYRILPVYLQLESQQPPGRDLPVELPRPELDEGPHLSYAVQWFIFATIAVVGYPLVLRRIAHGGGQGRGRTDIPAEYV